MKSIYLDDKYHLITISDEAYEQITQIINANKVCRRCKQPYTNERTMVSENLCLTCLLKKEENSLLTFVGLLSVDRYGTDYGFLDPKGYIHVSSTSSEKVELNEYQTLVHWGFPVISSYNDGNTEVTLDHWRWTIHGDVKHNSVLVLEHTEYSSGTRRAFLSYKGGGCVFFTRRKGAMRTLWNQAIERLQTDKGERSASSFYNAEIYEIVAELASAAYDQERKEQ